MKQNIDLGLLIFRLILGFTMLLHGIAKITGGIGGIEHMLGEHGLPGFIGYGVYIGEIVAPLLLIVGFKTRLSAAVFAFNCVVALLLAHAGDIFALGKYGGWAIELLALYIFGSLALAFTGGGKYSLDSKLKKR